MSWCVCYPPRVGSAGGRFIIHNRVRNIRMVERLKAGGLNYHGHGRMSEGTLRTPHADLSRANMMFWSARPLLNQV